MKYTEFIEILAAPNVIDDYGLRQYIYIYIIIIILKKDYVVTTNLWQELSAILRGSPKITHRSSSTFPLHSLSSLCVPRTYGYGYVWTGTSTILVVQIFNGGETPSLRDDDGDRRDTATPAHTATMSPVTHAAACFPWCTCTLRSTLEFFHKAE